MRRASDRLWPGQSTSEQVVWQGGHQEEAEHGDREVHDVETAELNPAPPQQNDEGRDQEWDGKEMNEGQPTGERSRSRVGGDDRRGRRQSDRVTERVGSKKVHSDPEQRIGQSDRGDRILPPSGQTVDVKDKRS